MIGRLFGVVAERGLDGACIVDVDGVGYEVFVPVGQVGRLPSPPEPATLHVHTHVREDAITLFGFPDRADREAFRVVMSVSGVGPKLALSVVSALSASGLARAIATQDRAAFKGISGIGKKLGERLLLELKDRVDLLSGHGALPALAVAPSPTRVTGPLAIVASALVQMGYKPSEADRAVSALGEPNGQPVEDLLRDALRQLG